MSSLVNEDHSAPSCAPSKTSCPGLPELSQPTRATTALTYPKLASLSAVEQEELMPAPAQRFADDPVTASLTDSLQPRSLHSNSILSGVQDHFSPTADVQVKAGSDDLMPLEDSTEVTLEHKCPFDSFNTTDWFFNPPTWDRLEENEPFALTCHSGATSRRSSGLANRNLHLISPELSESSRPTSPSPSSPCQSRQACAAGGVDMSSKRSDYRQQSYSRSPISSTARSFGDEPAMQATLSLSNCTAEPTPGMVYSTASAVAAVPPVYVDASDVQASAWTHHSETFGHKAPDAEPLRPTSMRSGSDVASSEYSASKHSLAQLSPTGRTGLDPHQRPSLTHLAIPSLHDQAQAAALDARNQEISNWLSFTSRGGASVDANEVGGSGDDRLRGRQQQASRLRTHSAVSPRDMTWGAPALHHDVALPHGAFAIAVEARPQNEHGARTDEATITKNLLAPSDKPTSVLPTNFPPTSSHHTSPGVHDLTLDDAAHPWVDPIAFPSLSGVVAQPDTANAAMARFSKRAQDLETVSRAATWGTASRRLSDGDLPRVFGGGGLLSRLNLSRDRETDKDSDEWRSFKDSVEQAAARFLPRKSGSASRRKHSDPTRPASRIGSSYSSSRPERVAEDLDSPLQNRGETYRPSARRTSASSRLNRPPRFNASAAGLISAASVASLGTSSTLQPQQPSPPTATPRWGALKHARGKLSRRSSQNSSEPSLSGLLKQEGGPPAPRLHSNTPEMVREMSASSEQLSSTEGFALQDQDADNNDATQMTVETAQIAPTLDGFRSQVRDMFPQLQINLVDRLAYEQLRRYKKLLEVKVRHAQTMQHGNCPSGAYCLASGAMPAYQAQKMTQQSSRPSSPSKLKTAMLGTMAPDEDEDENGADSIGDTTFAHGMPLPPTKRLPAEFECPLCFTVKRFQKPSDWSKHVHEDLQPFTCTFSACPDPKSFKRKADWVRHENERHRQLEWWQCTEEGCTHQCFRRDNFVQHLVREHKMPEPKPKAAVPYKKAVRGPAKSKTRGSHALSASGVALEHRVLHLVETCRHETNKSPMEEPCRFCGMVCNSFKKLTVHLARHMEQLSMPILEMVQMRDVTVDTIISPISSQPHSAGASQTVPELASYIDPIGTSPRGTPMSDHEHRLRSGMMMDYTVTTPGMAIAPGWQDPQDSLQAPGVMSTPVMGLGHSDAMFGEAASWATETDQYPATRHPSFNLSDAMLGSYGSTSHLEPQARLVGSTGNSPSGFSPDFQTQQAMAAAAAAAGTAPHGSAQLDYNTLERLLNEQVRLGTTGAPAVPLQGVTAPGTYMDGMTASSGYYTAGRTARRQPHDGSQYLGPMDPPM